MTDRLKREKCFKDRYLEITFFKKNQGLNTFKMLQYIVLRERIFFQICIESHANNKKHQILLIT